MSVCKKPVFKECSAILPDTGKKCKAQAVHENTFATQTINENGCKKVIRTRDLLDPRYCQMHQPGRMFKRRCKCPYCPVHSKAPFTITLTENQIEKIKKGQKTLTIDKQ